MKHDLHEPHEVAPADLHERQDAPPTGARVPTSREALGAFRFACAALTVAPLSAEDWREAATLFSAVEAVRAPAADEDGDEAPPAQTQRHASPSPVRTVRRRPRFHSATML